MLFWNCENDTFQILAAAAAAANHAQVQQQQMQASMSRYIVSQSVLF